MLAGVTTEDADVLRGDVRPGRRRSPFATEDEAVRDRQRHAVRPRRVLLRPRPRPGLAGLGGARVRDRRDQHRLRLDRGRAVRRRQGVRIGREGSKYGIEEWVEIKYWRWPGSGSRSMMIVEQRTTTLHGQAPRARPPLRGRGDPDPAAILGGFVGAFTTEIGALSTYTSMWRYDELRASAKSAARASRRTSGGRRSCQDPAAHPHPAEPDPDPDPVLAAPGDVGSPGWEGSTAVASSPAGAGDRPRDRRRARRRGSTGRDRRSRGAEAAAADFPDGVGLTADVAERPTSGDGRPERLPDAAGSTSSSTTPASTRRCRCGRSPRSRSTSGAR